MEGLGGRIGIHPIAFAAIFLAFLAFTITNALLLDLEREAEIACERS